MLKPEAILKEMPGDSTDVMCSGLLDRYVARPDSMEELTLAEFAADYNINGKDPNVENQNEDDHSAEDLHENTGKDKMV